MADVNEVSEKMEDVSETVTDVKEKEAAAEPTAASSTTPELAKEESSTDVEVAASKSSPANEVDRQSLLPPEVAQLLAEHWEEISKEAIELLQKLIQTDTQNFADEGTEMEAVLLLKEKFDQVGISYEIVEPKPGRGNIIARIHGDRSSGQGPFLLSAHLDTVHAPKDNWAEEGWKHNPFGGEIDEEDGCLYGRGAVDMKNFAAMSVSLLCFIKRCGLVLSRDLIFAGIADEERTTSKWGAKYLVENRPELIEADVIFNELGGFSMYLNELEAIVVQIGEKGSAQLKITATGPGGHGSIFHKVNPIARIGEIAHTLHTCRLPLRTNIANRASIESFARALPFPKSTVFRQLLNPTFSQFIQQRLLTDDQISSLAPLLHNTANPTVVGGGDQHNQIPSSAWLKVDARILPESTIDDVVDDIKDLIGRSCFLSRQGPNGEELPPELTLEVMASRGSCFQDPAADGCPEVLDAIRKVVASRAEGAPIVTTLIPGGTDFYWYSRHPTKKPICIGFTPMRIPRGMKFAALFHGTNERIPVDGFKWGQRVLNEVVCKLCSARIS